MLTRNRALRAFHHHTRCVVKQRYQREFWFSRRSKDDVATSSAPSSGAGPSVNKHAAASPKPDDSQYMHSTSSGDRGSASNVNSSSSTTTSSTSDSQRPSSDQGSSSKFSSRHASETRPATTPDGTEGGGGKDKDVHEYIATHWDPAVRNQMSYKEIVERDAEKEPEVGEEIAIDKEMGFARRTDLPANVPPVSTPDYKAGSLRMGWSFFPKPIQEGHEGVIAKLEKEGKLQYHPSDEIDKSESTGELLMSPDDQVRAFVDRLFVKLNDCKCGDDLVDVLRTEWLSAGEPLTSRMEALRRTLDAIFNLGQIKQFAFLSADSLDQLCQEIADACQKEMAVFSPSEIASLSWCLGKLGARPPALVVSLTKIVEKRLLEFNMAELGDIFFGFTELRIDCPPLWRHVRGCILFKKHRSLSELTPEQLCQMVTSVMAGYDGLKIPRRMVLKVAEAIEKMWRPKPYLSGHSLLQLCRFFTFSKLFFPIVEFDDYIPKDLREKATFAFQSGRVELYSPPFLDPMMRTISNCYYGLMHKRQMPECVGLSGWWVWDYTRINKQYSMEPASKTWYTRLDSEHRLLGQYMFRHRILKRFRIWPLVIPYYKFAHLATNAARSEVIATEAARQVEIYRLGVYGFDIVNALGVDTHGKLRSLESTRSPMGKIAWTWEELCLLNAMEGIDPSRFYNNTFQQKHAYYNYDTEDRNDLFDAWSPSTLEKPVYGRAAS